MARGTLSSIRVVTWWIYLMINCMQWSSVFTCVLLFKITVNKVIAYVRFIDAQEARADLERTDGMTGPGISNAHRYLRGRWTDICRGNCNDYRKWSFYTKMKVSLSSGNPWCSPQYWKSWVTWIPSQNLYHSELHWQELHFEPHPNFSMCFLI